MKGYNKYGVSIFLIRSDKGKRLIKMVNTNHFLFGEANLSLAIRHNPMYANSAKKAIFYDKFDEDFKQNGLSYAVS